MPESKTLFVRCTGIEKTKRKTLLLAECSVYGCEVFFKIPIESALKGRLMAALGAKRLDSKSMEILEKAMPFSVCLHKTPKGYRIDRLGAERWLDAVRKIIAEKRSKAHERQRRTAVKAA